MQCISSLTIIIKLLILIFSVVLYHSGFLSFPMGVFVLFRFSGSGPLSLSSMSSSMYVNPNVSDSSLSIMRLSWFLDEIYTAAERTIVHVLYKCCKIISILSLYVMHTIYQYMHSLPACTLASPNFKYMFLLYCIPSPHVKPLLHSLPALRILY